jgi:two-component system, sensor histidine kinase YesM
MHKIALWLQWVEEKFTQYFLFSFKSTILSLYIPIIIIFILITGMASYLLAAAQIEENAYRNIKNTVYQTGNYVDNRLADAFGQLVALSNHPDVLRIIVKQPEDIEPEDYIRVYQHIERIQSFYGTLIDSIFVSFHDGKFLLSKSDDTVSIANFSYREYRNRYTGNPYDVYWRNLHPDDFSTNDNRDYVISMFKLIGKDNSKINGIILFNLNSDFFGRVFANSLLSETGYLVLISPEGAMTFKTIESTSQLSLDVVQYLQQTKEKEGRFAFQKPQGEKMVVIYNTLPTNQWKLAAVFPQAELLDRVNYIKFITFLVIVLLIAVAVILTNALANYVTRPISALTDSMKRVQGKNIDFVSDTHPLNEVEVLNQGVKDLVERVKVLLEQIHKEQETKRQLEFSVMQMQIHPHFLYNTLYSIKGLCDMNLNEDASAMVTALSNFFRISISRGNEIISVEEEIEHIRNYLFIQEMRYGDDFSYEIQIETDILSYPIVKLTLQPLVENAIYHGVKQKRGIGLIRVIGYQRDGFLCFEVQDNGIGMSSERLQEIQQGLRAKQARETSMGLGVRSVHQRLQIHYGKEAGLQIESELEKGTIIKILIPIAGGEENQHA